MSVSLSRVDGPGDAELIAAVRGGDVDAYGELFARHVDAARRLAGQLAGPGDADDLVSDAFTKVLTVLQRGGGPDLAFRAYLLTAVRRLHVDRIRSTSRLRPVDDLTPFDPGLPFQDTAVEGFDNATAAKAFASLPERWQMVLWHTEVEQQKPADIAVLLGMSANSVSALAYRAREGLRQAFLSMHAADPDDVDCAWTRDHLGAYVRGGLSRRDVARVDDHLEGCRACAAVYLELTEVNSGLSALLAPLLLGTAGAAYLSSTGGAAAGGIAGVAGAGLSTTWKATRTWLGGHTAITAVGGVMAAAAASVAIYVGAQSMLANPASDNTGLVDRPLHSVASSGLPGGSGPGTGTGNPDGRGTNPAGGDATGSATASVPPATASVPTSSDPTADPQSGATGDPTVDPSTDPSTDPNTGPGGDPSNGPSGGTTGGPTDGPGNPTSGPGTNPTAQKITFDSTPPDSPAFGDTYTLSATGGGSGNPVRFSVDSSTTGVPRATFTSRGLSITDRATLGAACRIKGHTVHFDHGGTCVIVAEQAGNGHFADGTATQKVDVPKVRQSIRFSLPDAPARGSAQDLVATGGDSGNPVTFSSSTPDLCRASGSTVHFDHAGTCTIEAQQDGNQDYTAANVTRRADVPKDQQTITFALPDAPALHSSVTLDDVTGGDSGNPVTFSSATPDLCSVSGAQVTFDHAGVCAVDAHQNGNQDFTGANATSSATVARGTPTFQFALPAAGSVGTGDALSTTSDSDGPVTFTVADATTNNACALNDAGTTVRYQHVGSCVLRATQAASADYEAATDSQTVTVARGTPTFQFALPAAGSVGTGDALSTTSDSDGPVTFTVADATTNNACALNDAGTTVRYQHVGSCVLRATQAASADYEAATDSQSVTVGKGVQSTTFTSQAPPSAGVGDSYDVSATSGSGDPVTFSVDPATTRNACTVSGSTVTLHHAGTCVVAADQPGNADYEAADTITQSADVAKAHQAITFALAGKATVGQTVPLTATGGDSGNAVVFSSVTPTTCTVTGASVTLDHAGTCGVAADQAGDDDYTAAPTVDQTVAVARGAQSITFTSDPPVNPRLRTSYVVSATGGPSGNAVTFGSGSPAVCSVSGATVTVLKAGTCVVTADQAGSDDYDAAATATQSVDVAKAAQSITFTSKPPATPRFGATYQVAATGGDSGNPVTFSVDPATTDNACTVAGSTVTFRHAGTCVIAADQAGDDDHLAAPTVTQSVIVHKAEQSITFTSKPPTSPAVGTTYVVTATSGSGEPVSFSVDPSTTNAACTVAGSTVTFRHAGTCVVAADQAGDDDYAAAKTVTQSAAVRKGAQAVTFTSQAPDPGFVGSTYAVSATGGGSGNPVVFGSSTPAVCTISGSTVTFRTAGTCTVTANQAGSNDYEAAPSVSQSTSVKTRSGDLSVTAVVQPGSPLSDSRWHAVDVTVHDLAPGATATVTPSTQDSNVLVIPELNCWFQLDGICHVTSPPANPTVTFFVWVPSGGHAAHVTFTVASATSPDSDPSNNSVTVEIRPRDDHES